DKLDSIASRLRHLSESATCLERFDVLPHILMLGPPNAGKSSLMNRLSGTRRAICAAAAGTTRDVLSAPIRLDRGEAILLDSAGVDDCLDEITALAREGALAAAERVDAVCLVFDLTAPFDAGFVERIRRLAVPRTLIAANKCDLVTPKQAAEASKRLEGCGLGPVCVTSALDGAGIDELRRALTEAVARTGGTTLGESVLITERQREAVQGAISAIARASALARSAEQTADCAELVAFELRDALDRLGTVSGDVTTEDLLGQVFASFCIGK
ncbi:MAG: GTP-binding protein, partial [Planctomycetes bacterium]|nr:GTP-binding protein [Planctomycetota bacterium]